jgi:hypothetical protein
MLEVSLLLVSWLTIVFFIYRSIRRHELDTADNGEPVSSESSDSDHALSQLIGNPYIRMF